MFCKSTSQIPSPRAAPSNLKKLISQREWKQHLLRRQRNELRRRKARRHLSYPIRNAKLRGPRSSLTVVAPTCFSLIQNADESIAFLNRLKGLIRQFNLNLDFTNVSRITPDAMAALVSLISIDPRFKGGAVTGNLPSDAKAADLITGSGFLEYVKRVGDIKGSKSGLISRRQGHLVEPTVARDLVRHGMKETTGVSKPCPPAYRALIELMGNTHDHAAGEDNTKTADPAAKSMENWWATVYSDHDRQTSCFVFLDCGVGIFRSLKLRLRRRLSRKLGVTSDTDLLRDLLSGEIGSRTGLHYRGKGLPAIYQDALHGRIKSLHIIANYVSANVSSNLINELRSPFSGTLIYWEI
jgi:hypothetical protein